MNDSLNNHWFGISMALVGVIAGYAIATGMGTSSAPNVPAPAQVAKQPVVPAPAQRPTPPPAGDVKPVDPKVDHIRGNPNAKISVIEFSDYECPFCKRHHPTMVQLLKDYGDDVKELAPIAVERRRMPLARLRQHLACQLCEPSWLVAGSPRRTIPIQRQLNIAKAA